jgi:hypothetical protein
VILNRQQFASVTDLGEYRARRLPRRPAAAEMTVTELANHIQGDHGIPASTGRRGSAQRYLEYLHDDLHKAGPDAHVPWLEHRHD